MGENLESSIVALEVLSVKSCAHLRPSHLLTTPGELARHGV